MASSPVIALHQVTKRFGDRTAIDRLDLEVAPGLCVGLLGPNGAGKSTLMRLLTGQAIATAGTVRVLGLPLPTEARRVRARCGVVPQTDNLDAELTVAENLSVYARLHRIRAGERAAAVRRGLDTAGLADRADTPADELSGGMRRRLLIARGTLHQPQLVLLDEPTVGLDPQIRSQLWSQIEALRDRGVTTLLSTHYMEEAERLCDLVAVMHHGRLIAYDRPARLIADHVGKRVLEVTARAPRLADVERWARSVGLPTRRSGSTLVVMGVDGVAAPDALAADGQLRDATLEDVFVVLTGAELT